MQQLSPHLIRQWVIIIDNLVFWQPHYRSPNHIIKWLLWFLSDLPWLRLGYCQNNQRLLRSCKWRRIYFMCRGCPDLCCWLYRMHLWSYGDRIGYWCSILWILDFSNCFGYWGEIEWILVVEALNESYLTYMNYIRKNWNWNTYLIHRQGIVIGYFKFEISFFHFFVYINK